MARHRMRTRLAAALVLSGTFVGAAAGSAWGAQLAQAQSSQGQSSQETEFAGLPAGPGQEEVFYGCSACHSLRLVQQQGLSRQRWDKLLVWMVEEQGMAAPDDNDRSLMLDYLTKHYGPGGGEPGQAGGVVIQPLTPRPGAGGL